MLIEFRKAQPHDFEQIVALQNKNLRPEGFLATAFTLEQFKAMDASIGVVVCIFQEKIIGYICASTRELNQTIPRPAALLKHCSNIFFQEKSLTSYPLCVINPICIQKEFRGKEIYQGLFTKLSELIPNKFKIRLTFCDVQNFRSLKMIQNLGGKKIGQFQYEEERFWILCSP